MGAALLVETLAGLAAGSIIPEKQDNAQATHAPILKKEDGLVEWSQPALAVHNRVRGLQPWPGAFTTFRGQPLHIWKTRVPGQATPMAPGTAPGRILSLRPLLVGAADSPIELLEVQLEGRKRIPAADFVNGQRVAENELLGETSK